MTLAVEKPYKRAITGLFGELRHAPFVGARGEFHILDIRFQVQG